MTTSIDSLLEELLSLTASLAQKVEEQAEPEGWLQLLADRQRVMEQITALLRQGTRLTEEQKHYLQNMYETDQRLTVLIEQRREQVKRQLANIQKSKWANQQYNRSGYSAYGGFFDRRK